MCVCVSIDHRAKNGYLSDDPFIGATTDSFFFFLLYERRYIFYYYDDDDDSFSRCCARIVAHAEEQAVISNVQLCVMMDGINFKPIHFFFCKLMGHVYT